LKKILVALLCLAQILLWAPGRAADPDVAIDAAGRMPIFWDTWASSGKQFTDHRYQTSRGWSDPQLTATSLGSTELHTQPLFTPDGALHLPWTVTA
jgi:hypothetical protein